MVQCEKSVSVEFDQGKASVSAPARPNPGRDNQSNDFGSCFPLFAQQHSSLSASYALFSLSFISGTERSLTQTEDAV